MMNTEQITMLVSFFNMRAGTRCWASSEKNQKAANAAFDSCGGAYVDGYRGSFERRIGSMNNQNNTGWVLCPACGHKLFKIEYSQGGTKISIKCHSCKL